MINKQVQRLCSNNALLYLYQYSILIRAVYDQQVTFVVVKYFDSFLFN